MKKLLLALPLALAIVFPASAEGIKRTERPGSPLSNLVRVPAGYDTVFISGTTAGSGGTPIPEGADTKAQVTIIYEKFRNWLAGEGMTMADIVMLRVHLVPDQATGRMDTKGANEAYALYFGAADQPLLPSRITLPTKLGGRAMAEIEAIAAKKPAK
ncbi:hypothetical protein L288_17130 [Sphingobium quisquiliarum P25]|uniref:Endonuclease n=1 Tax=Sphingobium quisquiliarum P25 TaxID=1329909 RepID=T0HWM0_9SPHN|nr:hypothetical protein [Sphingobium quisquiliarum]EQB01944.1 hypothetical protein L288_17130 [Sphingobium quisquiliarum P25]EZP67328.1 Endonuclease [Sphingomonas paucimobilis]